MSYFGRICWKWWCDISRDWIQNEYHNYLFNHKNERKKKRRSRPYSGSCRKIPQYYLCWLYIISYRDNHCHISIVFAWRARFSNIIILYTTHIIPIMTNFKYCLGKVIQITIKCRRVPKRPYLVFHMRYEYIYVDDIRFILIFHNVYEFVQFFFRWDAS